MFRYGVYGLLLESTCELPELAPAASMEPAHVRVSCGHVPIGDPPVPIGDPPDEEAQGWFALTRDPPRAVCVFPGVARYQVDSGTHVLIDPEPGVDPRLWRHGLLGPVLAHLLWQRDVFTLHASVVRVNGHHGAFVGVSGEGKSTTAAALEAHGHALVCDDIAAIPWRNVPIFALPGFPRLRLYDDALRSVGHSPEQHPLVHGLIDKKLKRAERFVSEPVRLDKIYVLETADAAVHAELLPPQRALMQLMKHAYNAYQLAPSVGFQRHMEMAAKVSMNVPTYRLSRPKDLARLAELVRFLEVHLAS
jgi:hypothetical protein